MNFSPGTFLYRPSPRRSTWPILPNTRPSGLVMPSMHLLAAGGTGVDEEDVAVEHVGEWRGIGVAVRVDGGDDAVLAVVQDFARLVFGDRAFGQLLHGLVHGGSLHGDGGAVLLRVAPQIRDRHEFEI